MAAILIIGINPDRAYFEGLRVRGRIGLSGFSSLPT
jgi:hypothetical protein